MALTKRELVISRKPTFYLVSMTEVWLQHLGIFGVGGTQLNIFIVGKSDCTLQSLDASV